MSESKNHAPNKGNGSDSRNNGGAASNADYLIDETPVVFQPTLACVLGETGAIVLQQIHWLSHNSFDTRYKVRQREGRLWVQIKPHDILDPTQGHLRFLSLRTFRRAVADLEKLNCLIVRQFPVLGPANWYSVNREEIMRLVDAWKDKRASAVCQNGTGEGDSKSNAEKAVAAASIIDDEIHALPDDLRRELYEDAIARMGIVGRLEHLPSALAAMQRTIYREYVEQGKIRH